MVYSDVLSFSIMSKISFRMIYYIQYSCLKALLGYDKNQKVYQPLFLMLLTVLAITSQVFCRMSPIGIKKKLIYIAHAENLVKTAQFQCLVYSQCFTTLPTIQIQNISSFCKETLNNQQSISIFSFFHFLTITNQFSNSMDLPILNNSFNGYIKEYSLSLNIFRVHPFCSMKSLHSF